MNGVVKFKRLHNRTAHDVFRNMIQPKLTLTLNIICQKITFFNRQHHSYQNQTGALENSISWVPAKQTGDKVRAAVLAGGLSKALYTYVERVVFYYDEQGRLRRFEPKDPKVVNKGDQIFVDYAVFVEAKGMPVLKQGIEYFRHKAVDMAAQELRKQNLPRVYKFKYTGVEADLYGE